MHRDALLVTASIVLNDLEDEYEEEEVVPLSNGSR